MKDRSNEDVTLKPPDRPEPSAKPPDRPKLWSNFVVARQAYLDKLMADPPTASDTRCVCQAAFVAVTWLPKPCDAY